MTNSDSLDFTKTSKSDKDLLLTKSIERLIVLFPDKMALDIDETAKVLGLKDKKSIYNRLKKNAASPFPIKPKRVGRQLRWNIISIAEYLCSEE